MSETMRSAAARYHVRCRRAGVYITPALALAWARQTEFGAVGYFGSQAALDFGIGVMSPCGQWVRRRR